MEITQFDKSRVAFEEFYEANAVRLREAGTSFATLVQLLLSDADGIATPSVIWRLKDCDECVSKFKRKYLADCEKAGGDYEIAPHITDLIGVRVVCLYENELEAIAKVLGSEFLVLGKTNKAQQLEEQESEFGYKALHLDLKLNGTRSYLAEYRRFTDLRVEVQVRTAIQDAWSNLDHKIKYKKEVPHALRRRIRRLAALFELADQEFLLIRDDTSKLDAGASELVAVPLTGHSLSVAQADSIPQTPLSSAELTALMQGLAPHYTFDSTRADAFVQEVLTLHREFALVSLRDAVSKHQTKVDRYKNHSLFERNVRLNPYTVMRHVIYLVDRVLFRDILFDHQRSAFEKWLGVDDQPDSA